MQKKKIFSDYPRLICVILIVVVCVIKTQQKTTAAELIPDRTLYAVSHFGNTYEVMGENEFTQMLAEAKFWGFNAYLDWFDTIDCADPFVDPGYNMAGALWDHKKTFFAAAQKLGIKCYLAITPNHVYLDQCLPDLVARKEYLPNGKRVFGQLICPSKPKARQIILKNYKNLFEDLAKSGIKLSAICPCAYDYGGCSCPDCNPWIITFAKLTKEIHEIALQYHPNVEMRFIGWWWPKEDHLLFNQWTQKNTPLWANSIALWIPYGNSSVDEMPLPPGCDKHAFIHIGYADKGIKKDVYGHLGPVIAAERIEKTIKNLAQTGGTGFIAYSESMGDDINKALVAALASGKFNTADDVLNAYAKRYFNANQQTAQKWTAWIKKWQDPYSADPDALAVEFNQIFASADTDNWRLEQWRYKIKLMKLNKAIMAIDTWTPEKLRLVDQFWAVKESLERKLWGVGLLRHGLARHFAGVSIQWYDDWVQQKNLPVEKIQKKFNVTGQE
jgi:hypothetical protein